MQYRCDLGGGLCPPTAAISIYAVVYSQKLSVSFSACCAESCGDFAEKLYADPSDQRYDLPKHGRSDFDGCLRSAGRQRLCDV